MSQTVYSVYDKKMHKTQLILEDDILVFIADHSSCEDASCYDVSFALKEYGPQTINKRFLITCHTI